MNGSDRISAPRLDWRTKGLPPAAEGLTADEIGALGLNLLAGDLMMPAAVLREPALRHNVRAMQDFADRNGALLCPHGKTSMSPELFRMQLEAGAWGLTAATAHHLRVYRRLGVQRIFLANELVGGADIALVLGEIAADPTFDFYCLVDSVEGVALLAEAAKAAETPRPLQLLVETGISGGRTGVRSGEAALEVARAVAEAGPLLELRGVETFEGIHQTQNDARLEAGELIDAAVVAAHDIAAEGWFKAGPILLSAGGSAFLDLCAARLTGAIGGHEVVRIIRPGCYVTHDDGIYERITRPGGAPFPGLPDLQPALEVWGAVLSVPEPALAIVGVGKRDVSYDVEPPVPLRIRRSNAPLAAAEEMRVTALWDQHLALAVPQGAVAVGDLVGFGISHPCATFDRWTALLTVDDRYRVTGAVTTLF